MRVLSSQTFTWHILPTNAARTLSPHATHTSPDNHTSRHLRACHCRYCPDHPRRLPADCSAYASIPLPAEAENALAPKTPPACASYRSYRGIGRPVNYSKARACAWQERLAQQADLGQNQKEPTAWVVGGSLILADIYFNGAGVKRNIPLAMRFACESEEGMAKLALPDIAKLNGSLPLMDLSNSAIMPRQPSR